MLKRLIGLEAKMSKDIHVEQLGGAYTNNS